MEKNISVAMSSVEEIHIKIINTLNEEFELCVGSDFAKDANFSRIFDKAMDCAIEYAKAVATMVSRSPKPLNELLSELDDEKSPCRHDNIHLEDGCHTCLDCGVNDWRQN